MQTSLPVFLPTLPSCRPMHGLAQDERVLELPCLAWFSHWFGATQPTDGAGLGMLGAWLDPARILTHTITQARTHAICLHARTHTTRTRHNILCHRLCPQQPHSLAPYCQCFVRLTCLHSAPVGRTPVAHLSMIPMQACSSTATATGCGMGLRKDRGLEMPGGRPPSHLITRTSRVSTSPHSGLPHVPAVRPSPDAPHAHTSVPHQLYDMTGIHCMPHV